MNRLNAKNNFKTGLLVEIRNSMLKRSALKERVVVPVKR
jgi:hypothetical protein